MSFSLYSFGAWYSFCVVLFPVLLRMMFAAVAMTLHLGSDYGIIHDYDFN